MRRTVIHSYVAICALASIGADDCKRAGASSADGGHATCRDTHVEADIPFGNSGFVEGAGGLQRCQCGAGGMWVGCAPAAMMPTAAEEAETTQATDNQAASVRFLSPAEGAEVEQRVTFRIAGTHVARMRLEADGFPLGPPVNGEGERDVTYSFSRSGDRRIQLFGENASGERVATAELTVRIRSNAVFPINVPYEGPGPKQSFGYARGRLHEGVDLTPPHGVDPDGAGFPIFAYRGGVVVEAQNGHGYGIVRIRHDDGTYARYLHNRSVSVAVDARVEAGDTIALMGGRGPSGANVYPMHLHFEIENASGTAIEPRSYILNGRSPRADLEVRCHARYGCPRSANPGL